MRKFSFLIALLMSSIFVSCKFNQKTPKQTNENLAVVQTPDFNADSAYAYVAMQTSFGPRVPNTAAHQKGADYLSGKLDEYADNVIVQEFQARTYDGTLLNGKNIIGIFNPELKKRVFLAAHWDSRPFADQDPNPDNHHKAIDGANDGASGVGVLIEIARQMKIQKPDIGIDIILFDLEDFGIPEFAKRTSDSESSWALGSQYWSLNPHYPNYNAQYGILLDMVGAKDAVFRMEYFSMYYAPQIVKKVWKIAASAGYGDYFLLEDGSSVLDDHYFINRDAKIPTIDIIQHDNKTESGFYEHWHTIKDNLDAIDKQTLKAVGQVVVEVIYREK